MDEFSVLRGLPFSWVEVSKLGFSGERALLQKFLEVAAERLGADRVPYKDVL